MTPEEIETVDAWRQDLYGDVVVELLADREGATDPDMESFAEDLSTLAPGVRWKPSEEHPFYAPGFRIGENVYFQILPSQRELSPFLHALSLLAGGPVSLPEGIRKSLTENELPATIRVYVAPGCPHCPAVVRQLLDFAAESGRITVHVVDGERFPEMAKRDAVRSVPTVLLEDRFRWTGSVPAGELAETILRRDPSMLGVSSLRTLIENGDAQRVADIMLAAGTVNPHLFDLLCHEKWPVRLGAMVVMEAIAEDDPELAAEAAEPLLLRLPEMPPPVQGDLLHVLGETGPDSILQRLQEVAADGARGDEVREAAREAAASIRSRAHHGSE